MAERAVITTKEAANILQVSEKTVRRYGKDSQAKHRLATKAVQGKFGEELRFFKDEVEALAAALSKGVQGPGESTGHDQGKPVDSAGQTAAISGEKLWTAYQALQAEYRNAIGQMGFWQAKADEVKLLTQEAESLRGDKTRLHQANDEATRALEAVRAQNDLLAHKLVRNQITYLVVFFVAVVLFVWLSPFLGRLVTPLFGSSG